MKSYLKTYGRIVAKPLDLASRDAIALLGLWHGRKARRSLPAWDDFGAASLRRWIGDINLLDALDDGLDFRYRVYGTRMAEAMGHDMTGRTISQLADERLVGASLTLYRMVYETRAPQFSFHRAPSGAHHDWWLRLVLPLSSDDRVVDRLIGYGQPILSATPDRTLARESAKSPEAFGAELLDLARNTDLVRAAFESLQA